MRLMVDKWWGWWWINANFAHGCGCQAICANAFCTSGGWFQLQPKICWMIHRLIIQRWKYQCLAKHQPETVLTVTRTPFLGSHLSRRYALVWVIKSFIRLDNEIPISWSIPSSDRAYVDQVTYKLMLIVHIPSVDPCRDRQTEGVY